MYMSAEQRLNYLVKIDTDGKIRWARNDVYVDTSPNKWVDAGEGKGIFPATGKEPVKRTRTRTNSSSSSSSSSESAEAITEHYVGVEKDPNLNPVQRFFKGTFTTTGLMERLLRKTVAKNTWLYVSVSTL